MITVERIQRTVAAYYGIGLSAMLEDSRHRSRLHPRQVAMYLSRRLITSEWLGRVRPRHSYPALGRMFDGRDHSTVWNACRSVERRIHESRAVERDVGAIIDTLFGLEID